MAYRISIGGGVPSQVRGVASDQIGRAVRELQDEEIPVDERIHQVRKRLKKLRGLLRLVRPAMGEQ